MLERHLEHREYIFIGIGYRAVSTCNSAEFRADVTGPFFSESVIFVFDIELGHLQIHIHSQIISQTYHQYRDQHHASSPI